MYIEYERDRDITMYGRGAERKITESSRAPPIFSRFFSEERESACGLLRGEIMSVNSVVVRVEYYICILSVFDK